ncbi:hypothetical protein DPMN_071475 [Dreissena polymorpha]|uniref:Uncharacterized protein n=1 Tax=Dreissena polymorpha TaxID=45954 RepID=A0A9D3Z6R8_DREPO|nr:hypothetical protein DPMN_071475 [Dreissena polymorpha]
MVNIKTKQDNPSYEVPRTKDQILQVAGKAFDNLLSASADKEISTHGDMSFMDSTTILTIKSVNKKATHITQFLTEKTKRRRQNKRIEYVLRESGDRPQNIRRPPLPRNLHRRMGGCQHATS